MASRRPGPLPGREEAGSQRGVHSSTFQTFRGSCLLLLPAPVHTHRGRINPKREDLWL